MHEQDAIKINKQRLEKQLDQASHYISQAERKQRMVKVLIESDFSDEAAISLHEAFKHSMQGFLYLTNQQTDKPLSLAEVEALTIEHGGPIMMPALFTELTEFKNKTSDVKQLHYQHQLALDHLYQMKDDLVAQI